jgi:hypothetical protein
VTPNYVDPTDRPQLTLLSELNVPEPERTLITYVDSRISSLDTAMNHRMDKQDETLLRAEGKLDRLLEFKPAAEIRLTAVEAEVAAIRKRPLRTWQIVVGGISLLAVLCGLGTTVMFDLVNIFITVHK